MENSHSISRILISHSVQFNNANRANWPYWWSVYVAWQLLTIHLYTCPIQVWGERENGIRWSAECPADLRRTRLGLRDVQLLRIQRLRLCILADQVHQERYWISFAFRRIRPYHHSSDMLTNFLTYLSCWMAVLKFMYTVQLVCLFQIKIKSNQTKGCLKIICPVCTRSNREYHKLSCYAASCTDWYFST